MYVCLTNTGFEIFQHFLIESGCDAAKVPQVEKVSSHIKNSAAIFSDINFLPGFPSVQLLTKKNIRG